MKTFDYSRYGVNIMSCLQFRDMSPRHFKISLRHISRLSFQAFWRHFKIRHYQLSSYQLALKSPHIRINLCSFYTKTYGIEPLCTRINSRSFYTKRYVIEPYHVLPILWWVTFLPYPGVQDMYDQHLIRGIILILPVITRDITFPCPWYQS